MKKFFIARMVICLSVVIISGLSLLHFIPAPVAMPLSLGLLTVYCLLFGAEKTKMGETKRGYLYFIIGGAAAVWLILNLVS